MITRKIVWIKILKQPVLWRQAKYVAAWNQNDGTKLFIAKQKLNRKIL